MILQLEENKFRWLPQQKPSGARGQNWHARTHKYLAAAPGSWDVQKNLPRLQLQLFRQIIMTFTYDEFGELCKSPHLSLGGLPSRCSNCLCRSSDDHRKSPSKPAAFQRCLGSFWESTECLWIKWCNCYHWLLTAFVAVGWVSLRTGRVYEGGWPFCFMMIFWKCWEHVPDVCTMWIPTVWIPSFSNRFFPWWQGNLNFALKKYSNAQAAYEAWTSQIADLWQKPFQSRSNSSSHFRKSGDLDKGMGTLKKTNILQGKHVFHKMRWMSVRLSGGRRLVAQKQKATLVSCKALEAVSICVSDSRGSWNFNKSFEVAKLPFSSFPAPKFFAHLIWIPHFFHSGLGAVYTKLGWSEEAMSKMIEAQEAFQVGLGMAEMRDEGNMHNISQYVHLLYNYILNCV